MATRNVRSSDRTDKVAVLRHLASGHWISNVAEPSALASAGLVVDTPSLPR